MTIGKDFSGKAESDMKKFSDKRAKEIHDKKERSLDELRQTKDSSYTAPLSHDEALEKTETISLTVDEIKGLMDDVGSGRQWSDSSYKILEFIGQDPTDGI